MTPALLTRLARQLAAPGASRNTAIVDRVLAEARAARPKAKRGKR